jgi:hypothetical protein
MVMPMDEELQTPTKSKDKTLLTPGLRSPEMDTAYSNQLQNPDSYGPLSKIKQLLSMINSKVQWNRKCSSFDEMKRLIEGHFEGYGAAYLVSQKFIKVYYIKHVFKVLQFFPCIRIRINHLEKQNGTLYGSLKQICQKSAGLVILQKHEVQCDGMRTWIEFLDHYDNTMGSNNIITIYFYDKVISCPYAPLEVSRRLGTVCHQL